MRYRLLVTGLTVAATGFPAAAASACAGAGVMPTASNLDRASTATICVINRQRANNGLGALADSSLLHSSATALSIDMVDHGFFAHVSPTAGDLVTRLHHNGYIAAGRRWRVGENLARERAIFATPARTVSGWMHSPEHRANILNPGFREIGVGVDPRASVSGAGSLAGATYTADFGSRSGGSAPAGPSSRPRPTHRSKYHLRSRRHPRRHH